MACTMLKPDSTRYPSFVQTRSIGPEWNQPDVLDPGVEANDSQVFKSQTDLPSELALDLRRYSKLDRTTFG